MIHTIINPESCFMLPGDAHHHKPGIVFHAARLSWEGSMESMLLEGQEHWMCQLQAQAQQGSADSHPGSAATAAAAPEDEAAEGGDGVGGGMAAVHQLLELCTDDAASSGRALLVFLEVLAHRWVEDVLP